MNGDLRPQQLVDVDAVGHEQREHHARHEQQADQRHAADQLDIEHTERPDRRQFRARPSATRIRAENRRQARRWRGSASPAARPSDPGTRRRGRECRPTSAGRSPRARRPRPAPVPSPGPAPARDHEQRDEQQHQRRPPLLLERIGAEQDEAEFFGDHRPAGAVPRTARQALVLLPSGSRPRSQAPLARGSPGPCRARQPAAA